MNMPFRHSVIVIVINGDRKKNRKCQTLLKRGARSFILNTMKPPMISGKTAAAANNHHLAPISSLENWGLKNTTRSSKSSEITEPAILERFELEISKKRPLW